MDIPHLCYEYMLKHFEKYRIEKGSGNDVDNNTYNRFKDKDIDNKEE